MITFYHYGHTLHGNGTAVINGCRRPNGVRQKWPPCRDRADGILLIYYSYGVRGKHVFSCAVYRVCCYRRVAPAAHTWWARIDRIPIWINATDVAELIGGLNGCPEKEPGSRVNIILLLGCLQGPHHQSPVPLCLLIYFPPIPTYFFLFHLPVRFPPTFLAVFSVPSICSWGVRPVVRGIKMKIKLRLKKGEKEKHETPNLMEYRQIKKKKIARY